MTRQSALSMVSRLDFIVIGAQKAGTTALWQLLRDHPNVWIPTVKEAPFFSHTEVYRRGLATYLERLGAPSEAEVMRGTVTPHYMHGWHDASTAEVARRIAATVPTVRLVAILRDPIERAQSQHRMSVARGREDREFNDVVDALLEPRALFDGRTAPHDTNTYIVQGEYRRVLEEYLSVLPAGQLHVEYTADLVNRPVETVQRILRFLGVESRFVPTRPQRRVFRSGLQPRTGPTETTAVMNEIEGASPGQRRATVRRRLDGRVGEDALNELVDEVERYEGALDRNERAGLRFFIEKVWNVEPSPPDPIPSSTCARLVQHYAPDIPVLDCLMGRRPPWAWTGS
ncbi:MAG: sulfotransferase family protein [Solirubrobacteraceae bacterium]